MSSNDYEISFDLRTESSYKWFGHNFVFLVGAVWISNFIIDCLKTAIAFRTANLLLKEKGIDSGQSVSFSLKVMGSIAAGSFFKTWNKPFYFVTFGLKHHRVHKYLDYDHVYAHMALIYYIQQQDFEEDNDISVDDGSDQQ